MLYGLMPCNMVIMSSNQTLPVSTYCVQCKTQIERKSWHHRLKYCPTCRKAKAKKPYISTAIHPPTTNCAVCGDALTPAKAKARAKVCSVKCRGQRDYTRFREVNKYFPISPGTRGAVSELQVASDLMLKGFNVFRALSSNASCDLAIVRKDKLLRIEVRTGYRTPAGSLSFPKKPAELFDVMAVVESNGTITYMPPIDPGTS